MLALVLATALIAAASLKSGDASSTSAACTAAADCYLNGACLKGRCECHAGWTGPHCGQFDFLPTPPGPLGGKAFPAEDDESTWGTSVIKGADGTYHMYTSGILGKCGLAVWAPNAALTHAVSDTLAGPYEAREDIMRGSNPQITEFRGELRLWHTLSGGPGGPSTPHYCKSCTNGSTPASCRNESLSSATAAAPISSKLVVASQPSGPWRNVNVTCKGYGPHGECPTTSNPTAFYYENGTTLLMYDWQCPTCLAKGFFIARAPEVSGPYTPASGNWTETTVTWTEDVACTDPFLWRDGRKNFHAVFHCRNWFKGSQPSDGGGHAFSTDGVTWTLAPEPAWTTTVQHTDGRNTTFFHRERPQLFLDPRTGDPAALFNAMSLANLNQPFPWQAHCPEHPSHIQTGCDQSMAFVQRIRGPTAKQRKVSSTATASQSERQPPAASDRPALSGMLTRDGAQLRLNGKPYAGVGVDIVDLLWANNTRALEDAAALGMPFVRVAASPFYPLALAAWRKDPETYWQYGAPGAGSGMAIGMDAAVAAARRLRVRLVPNLLWNIFAFADLCDEPLGALFNGSDSCSRRAAGEYVAQAARRYRGEPAVLFMELSNENNALVDGWLNGSTSGCAAGHGTPARRTDADNFDTGQMVATHAWLAEKIRAADPARLVNAGNSLPRPSAQHWRQTPRAEVRHHRIDSTPDNRSDFVANLLATNAAPAMDFVSGHVGFGAGDAARPFRPAPAPPVWLPELARSAAAERGQPFYLGEFSVAPASATAATARNSTYAEAILDWVLDTDKRLGGGGGVLASVWVFEFSSQNSTFSVLPGRDSSFLQKLQAANRILSNSTAKLKLDDSAASTYVSILGDPGMRTKESATALSGWKLCDGVQQPLEFPIMPATARLADCWVGGRNRVRRRTMLWRTAGPHSRGSR